MVLNNLEVLIESQQFQTLPTAALKLVGERFTRTFKESRSFSVTYRMSRGAFSEHNEGSTPLEHSNNRIRTHSTSSMRSLSVSSVSDTESDILSSQTSTDDEASRTPTSLTVLTSMVGFKSSLDTVNCLHVVTPISLLSYPVDRTLYYWHLQGFGRDEVLQALKKYRINDASTNINLDPVISYLLKMSPVRHKYKSCSYVGFRLILSSLTKDSAP